MRIRQWIQQNAVHKGKKGCVRADAQRKRKNCDCREAGILRANAQAVATVFEEFAPPEAAPGGFGGFFHETNIAELPAGGLPRGALRFAALDAVLRGHREVGDQLVVEIFTSRVFFFSSRRRHTRLTCDWSSDVCSSD